MTDGDSAPGRRDVLKYLGGAGVAASAGLGAFATTGSQPAGAEVLASSPVSTLPGVCSRDTARFHEQSGDRTLLNADVVRGIQMVNFRTIRAEDAVRGLCGGGDALEYQFVAYGMANSQHRVETSDGEFEPVDPADGSHPIAASSSDRPRVSANVEETPCGAATLRPHTVQVTTSDDPADAFAPYRAGPTPGTTEDVLNRTRASSDVDDLKELSIGKGILDGVAWNSRFGLGPVEEHWPAGRSAGADLEAAGRYLDFGLFSAEVLSSVADAYYSSGGNQYGLHSFEATDDGGYSVKWVADFTVRVPAGESLTVDVESWASPIDTVSESADQNFLTAAVTPGIDFEISIPQNQVDSDLEALDLPSIGTEPADGVPWGNPAIAGAPESPASGTGSFALDDDEYVLPRSPGGSLDVVDSQWIVDNGSSDAETLEYDFRRNGPHTVEAQLEADSALWEDDVSLGSRHMLSFDVGEALHTQPAVQFTVDPARPSVDESVTAEIETASSQFGSVQSVDWSVSSRKLGEFPDGETTDVCVPGDASASGDAITVTPQCGGVYRFTCTVTDDAGNPPRTVVQDVVVERQTIARFDVDLENPTPGDRVALDASTSTAGYGDPQFEWTVTAGPSGGGGSTSDVTPTDNTGEALEFVPDSIRDYTVELRVVDEVGDEDVATSTIEVQSAASCGGEPVADATTVDGRTVCDVNGDGLYRDVTGDGSVGQTDVTVFFEHQHRDAWKRPDLFDFSGDGSVGHGDVTELFEYVAQS